MGNKIFDEFESKYMNTGTIAILIAVGALLGLISTQTWLKEGQGLAGYMVNYLGAFALIGFAYLRKNVFSTLMGMIGAMSFVLSTLVETDILGLTTGVAQNAPTFIWAMGILCICLAFIVVADMSMNFGGKINVNTNYLIIGTFMALIFWSLIRLVWTVTRFSMGAPTSEQAGLYATAMIMQVLTILWGSSGIIAALSELKVKAIGVWDKATLARLSFMLGLMIFIAILVRLFVFHGLMQLFG